MAGKDENKKLTLLGRSETRLPSSPSDAHLETFPNPAKRRYTIRFETSEFTSLCPVTGQVDFAQITLEYVPKKLCVESKSLKFYLASYRNECGFNEAITNRILDDIVAACAPREAVVTAEFAPRGGIGLTVRVEYPEPAVVGRDSVEPGALTEGSTESHSASNSTPPRRDCG